MFRFASILVLLITSILHAADTVDYSRPLSPPWRSSLVAESVANLPLSTGPEDAQAIADPGGPGAATDGIEILNRWKIPLPEGDRAQQAADEIAAKIATEELTRAQLDAVCDAVTQHERASIYAKLLAFRLQHLFRGQGSDNVIEFSIAMSNPPGNAREQLALLALARGYFDAAAACGNAEDTQRVLKLIASTRVTDPVVKAAYQRELQRMKPLHEHAELVLSAMVEPDKRTPRQRTITVMQDLLLGQHPDMDPDLILKSDSAELKALLEKSRDGKATGEEVAELWFEAARKNKAIFAAGLERTAVQYLRVAVFNSKHDRSDERVKQVRRIDPRYMQALPPHGGELAIPLPTPESVVFVLDPSLRADAGRWASVQAMVLDELDLLTDEQTTNVMSVDAKGGVAAADLQKLLSAGDPTEAAAAEWMKGLEASNKPSDAALKAALKLKPDWVIFVTSALPAKPAEHQALVTNTTRVNTGGATTLHCVLVDSRSRQDAQSLLDLATLNDGIFWHINTTAR